MNKDIIYFICGLVVCALSGNLIYIFGKYKEGPEDEHPVDPTTDPPKPKPIFEVISSIYDKRPPKTK